MRNVENFSFKISVLNCSIILLKYLLNTYEQSESQQQDVSHEFLIKLHWHYPISNSCIFVHKKLIFLFLF